MSRTRGTGAVLFAVDVSDDHAGGRHRGQVPPVQDAYRALSRASVPSEDLDVRMAGTRSFLGTRSVQGTRFGEGASRRVRPPGVFW